MTARRHYAHIDVTNLIASIANGTIPVAKLEALTASRLLVSSAGGVITPRAALTASRLLQSGSDGLLDVLAAITADRALISDANGFPTHSTLTAAQLAALSSAAVSVTDTSTVNLTLSGGALSADVERTPTALGFAYISSVTASSSASVTFTGLSTYGRYHVVMDDIASASDNVNLLWRASTDNGSSYVSTASYNWGALAVGTAGVVVGAGGAGATSVQLAAGMGNAATTEAGSGTFDLIHRGSGSTVSRVLSQFTYRNQASETLYYTVGGTYNVGAAVNAIQFFMSSGNISRGTFRLYGMKES